MSSKVYTPDPARIGDDTLMRLGVAAALEFPDGSMSASGLRSEAAHGHLEIWRIAGKDYTTRKALKEMREQCARPTTTAQFAQRPQRPPSALDHQGSRAEISTGAGAGERAKAEIALANYLLKNRRPSFGDGHPDQVLIGDCLAEYCEKHGPTIARPDGLALRDRAAGGVFRRSRRVGNDRDTLPRLRELALRADRQARDQDQGTDDQADDGAA